MVVRGRVRGVASALALVCSSSVQAAAAQNVAAQSGPRFELGAQFVAAASSEFDTDRGVSVGLALRPVSLWSAEGEIAFYPSAYPDESEFSRSRVEGLFGVGVGPLVGRLRPFAKARAGFLTYRAASDPI
jgi:hypothetical protein